jgi:phosphoglycolate phosphatase
MAAYQRHYLAINGERATLYPGVIEGLHGDEGTGPAPGLRHQQADRLYHAAAGAKGLAPFFELVYGGDSLPKKKPDPLPLQQVCRDFGLAPAQVVAIGDSSNDAEAARAAGCYVLTVPYGYNHGRPVQTTDSDGIVDSLLDAAKLISCAQQH